MTDQILMAQLYALRAQLEAVIMQVERSSQPVNSENCKHENKVDLSAMGVDKWECLDCGYIHEQKL